VNESEERKANTQMQNNEKYLKVKGKVVPVLN
jgi:hypothetical protein